MRGSAARYAVLRGERPRRTPPVGVDTDGTVFKAVVDVDTAGTVAKADTGGKATLREPQAWKLPPSREDR